MHQDPSSQEYADEVARLRASESDSDAELLVCLDIFPLYSPRLERAWSKEIWAGASSFHHLERLIIH